LEPKGVVGLQYDGAGEVLVREAGVEMAEHNLIHVLRPDPGMIQGLVRGLDDETFDSLVAELAERRMGPTDDTGRHGATSKMRGSRDRELWLNRNTGGGCGLKRRHGRAR